MFLTFLIKRINRLLNLYFFILLLILLEFTFIILLWMTKPFNNKFHVNSPLFKAFNEVINWLLRGKFPIQIILRPWTSSHSYYVNQYEIKILIKLFYDWKKQGWRLRVSMQENQNFFWTWKRSLYIIKFVVVLNIVNNFILDL